MRSEDKWGKVQSQVLETLSPRIQRDFFKYPSPEVPLPVESTYIWGKVGGGKTLYAVNMLLAEQKELYLSGKDKPQCHFLSMPEFFNTLKKNMKTDRFYELLDLYSLSHFLVMDDLGLEGDSSWAINILYILINRRCENLLKTVITSNINLTELSVLLKDDRIPHRIGREFKVIKLERDDSK